MFKVQVPIAAAGGMGRDNCGSGFRGKSESRKKNRPSTFFWRKESFLKGKKESFSSPMRGQDFFFCRNEAVGKVAFYSFFFLTLRNEIWHVQARTADFSFNETTCGVCRKNRIASREKKSFSSSFPE